MSLLDILSIIDADITRLQQARALIAKKPAKAKRTLSAEARKRIGDAQRKRWAAQKKAAK
jgi:hypothetical protein